MKAYVIIGLLILLSSCHQKQTFDKTKWAEQGDLMQFPNRKYMIDDLLKNITLKGRTHAQIIDILGQPQSELELGSDFRMSYDVDIDYGKDIDPVYTKKLTIIFSSDTIVRDARVIEWKK